MFLLLFFLFIPVFSFYSEQKCDVAFGLLPILFPGRRKGKGGRYSTREAQLGFIDVQNVSWVSMVFGGVLLVDIL